MSRFTAGFRRVVVCLWFAVAALLLLAVPARSEVLPPLRVPDLAIGTRCFGFLPCTWIDPFGIRLRAGVLAVFRPEKDHDRDFYAARIQIAPSITLMQWAEIGVAIPITLYEKEIGVSPVLEPLQPFGRVRLPLEGFLGGIATTAFVRVHIASGPFVGGLPPLPSSSATPSPMPDLMAQALQAYRPQTQFELGLALMKRIGPVSATGAIGTSVSPGRTEIYGGGELAYHFKIFHAFLQGQGIAIPKCPPEEAALNFCGRGFRFGTGVRFDWDLGQGGLMIGTGSGAAEPGWEVGVQFGLDYDETTRRRHGDGVEAAQRWWDRQLEAMARGWAKWKSSAAVWHDEEEAARRAQPVRHGPFSGLLGGAPPPSSPWLDALLDDAPDAPLFPDFEPGAKPPASGGNPATVQAPKLKPSRKPPKRSLFAEANARAALARQLAHEPQFVLPGDLQRMADEELDRLALQMTKERLRQEEQQRYADAATPLPDWGLVALNTAALAPFAMTFTVLAASSPEGAAKVAEAKRTFRPFKYSPGEEEVATAMEDGLMALFSVGAGGAAAADAALARVAMMRAAERGAVTASQRAAVQAAERVVLGVAEEGAAAELGGSRVDQFFASVRDRLNPMNYECCGLGSNFGNLRYRGPRPATKIIQTIAEHDAPMLIPAGEAQAAEVELSTAAQRAIRSTEAELAAHRAKLAAYRENPMAFDNKGYLANNADNPEIQKRIIEGRIHHLENEIANFEKRLEELRAGRIEP